MQESYWNKNSNQPKHGIFSQLQIPPDTPFFVRLDGRRLHAISKKPSTEEPFDEKFAECLVASARALYQNNLEQAKPSVGRKKLV